MENTQGKTNRMACLKGCGTLLMAVGADYHKMTYELGLSIRGDKL